MNTTQITLEDNMVTLRGKKLTAADCKHASCGQIDGDGVRHPRHAGNQTLSLDTTGGKRFGVCQGCGAYFSLEQVLALLVAR